MNTAVNAFLSKHNFVCHSDVEVIAQSILDDMNRGLAGLESDEDMIPTWCLPPDKKACDKKVIVIDAGGTNFRSCLVNFDSNGAASISDMEKTKMPGVEKELNKKEFFEQLASNLEHLKNKADRIGFCFSYPMQITDDGDGVLLGFSKEVKAPEVIGSKIGECLNDALCAAGWNRLSRITMLNDTVAALLAGAAAPLNGNEYSSYIGYILGTGMNAAYIQPKLSEKFPKQIVVCESGKTKNVVRSDFDVAFDNKSVKPGTFYMEKMCAGAYLGPVAFEMLTTAAKENLFSEKVNKALASMQSFSTIDMNMFLHGPYGDESPLSGLLKSAQADDKDFDTIFQLLDSLAERSARHAAGILAAAVIQSGEGKLASKPVCLLCNGTTFHRTYMIKERVAGYLDELLTKQKKLFWRIVSLENDITLGTAIAGLIE